MPAPLFFLPGPVRLEDRSFGHFNIFVDAPRHRRPDRGELKGRPVAAGPFQGLTAGNEATAVGEAERPSRGIGSSHHPLRDVLVQAFTYERALQCWRRLPSSPWQKSRGRRLRLWLGLFVVETPRISINTRRFSASIPSQSRGASPRGTFATGC